MLRHYAKTQKRKALVCGLWTWGFLLDREAFYPPRYSQVLVLRAIMQPSSWNRLPCSLHRGCVSCRGPAGAVLVIHPTLAMLTGYHISLLLLLYQGKVRISGTSCTAVLFSHLFNLRLGPCGMFQRSKELLAEHRVCVC